MDWKILRVWVWKRVLINAGQGIGKPIAQLKADVVLI
jgi:hypothetical protein